MSQTSLSDVIADALTAPDVFRMPRSAAEDLARTIVQVAARRGHAGVKYYLPALHNLTREERNARIRTEFNGRNVRELSRKYVVTTRTIYRILRRNEMDADDV